jgi:hypothetical protein
MAITSQTIEFDLATGEFFRLERKRTALNPAPLARLFQAPSASLYPMLTPNDFVAHSAKGDMMILHRFLEIPFRTDFKIAEVEKNKVLAFPAYGLDVAAVRADSLQFVFTPQADQFLWLVLDLAAGYCYIIAQDQVSGRLHVPGLPNTYSNGTLCTGQAQLPDPGQIYLTGSMAFLAKWLEAWSTCEFNADLHTDLVGRVCRFDLETKTNVRDKNWRKYNPVMAPPGHISVALALAWSAITGNEVPK